ncbi:hypothetical protein GCM10010520_59660 [Rhizobium viscosum]|uniref:Uncharacterized protein n=1 Tax=Rhizobium viscosum TaxID=1673 RepID=A0ABR9ITI9_RHIVS|nr:hypothetical protein [Rhizobium viscosum]
MPDANAASGTSVFISQSRIDAASARTRPLIVGMQRKAIDHIVAHPVEAEHLHYVPAGGMFSHQILSDQ